MKIKKMIESLEKFSKLNPDANVKLHGKCGESALFILGTKNDNETIWIESESDVNMKEEISERFKYIDECDKKKDCEFKKSCRALSTAKNTINSLRKAIWKFIKTKGPYEIPDELYELIEVIERICLFYFDW